jgi:AmmeMemoRadiSam system radical SAM enzyme/AmmeMemoRadiSam system protein B/AmmeMemoRadiSam system protein A
VKTVGLPPETELRPDGTKLGGWWHTDDAQGRIVCDLCPRGCRLKPGDRGFCFVRENQGGEMVLSTYGRSTGFCIDPIEKKPLNHFYPGSSILSFGTAGCNLGCKFCQNWDISKSREVERLSEVAAPEAIAEAARQHDCLSVAYTYNDPIIWAEYAIDTARACRAVGVKSVAVTAGYITSQARRPFFLEMDAANVDLKAFTEEFYHKLTYSHLQPVLDTLEWLKRETDCWFEITNLVIPQANDSPDEWRQMCDWILQTVGDEVPVHFTAFHPDFRMQDRPRTPLETLLAARELALRQGLKYAYTGNVDDVRHQSTYCPHCGRLVIERNWYDLGVYALRGDQCGHCGGRIAGRFAESPGTWGRKRLPVHIARFAHTPRRNPQAPPQQERRMTTTADSGSTAAAGTVAMGPQLSPEQEAAIHRAACEVVKAGVLGRPSHMSDPAMAGSAQQTVMGAFVTLRRKGQLRACCGTLGAPMPLGQAVQHAALRTATEDSRFPTISPTELPHFHLDVTLLYDFQPVTSHGADRIREVQVGKHGLHIRRGNSAGLLLPSVATDHGWDAETFLQQVCRKAGLPSTAWMADDAQLQKFEGHMIPGDFAPDVLGNEGREKTPPFSAADLQQLADQCRVNVLALVHGATPNYYLPGCPDGTVAAAVLSVRVAANEAPLRFSQLSLRPGVPLQATLFQLCEAAANALRRLRLGREALNRLRVDLTVLTDPAMHGVVADADLRGIDPARRAVLVVEQGKTAWVLDPQKRPQVLLDAAARGAKVRIPEAASVFSLSALSTEPAVEVSSVPLPVGGGSVRPPAVAGMFYPADPKELNQMVETMLANGHEPKEKWPAVMVPHAGLIYSGRLAAATFRRVEFPETVILIGPKHTRSGVEWAVAPHDTWSLPGLSVPSDPELARLLAECIPGLELDSAAHQQEHCLEVQLPFLAKLAPQSRVVGITLGAGDLARCRQFAAGLANALRDLRPRPLLVISTDMNHFASESENRRLDEIALRAVETLDPANLYETVVNRHHISMCGVRPAVVVLETLRQLQVLTRCERVGYATSAEVSGDTSRVVGYAGMLFA